MGRRLGMQDGTGSSGYSYDSLGRLTQSTNGAGAQLQYGYDLKGQLTSLVYPGGVNTVSRSYDDAGRLHTVQDWLSHTTTFKFDANSNLFEQDYPNATIAALTYNAADQLTGITDSLSGTPFVGFTYGRDNVEQVASDAPKSYGYDANSRLQTSTNGATTTYGYDNADRLSSAAISGGGNTTTQVYDSGDQIQTLTVTNGVTQIAKTTYGFDSNGNRTSAAVQGGSTNLLGYDQVKRLVSYGATTSYAYDGDGLRASKTVSGTVENFTWDVSQGLPLIVAEGTTSYVTGLGGLPLEQITGSLVYYFHTDQLGSTRALTDSTGQVQQTYDYDPYGKQLSAVGGVVNSLQFGGQSYDSESGFYYLRARYYDPACGQFLSTDPAILATRRAYGYAADNPANSVDPSGLSAWSNITGYVTSHDWGSGLAGVINTSLGATKVFRGALAIMAAPEAGVGALIGCALAIVTIIVSPGCGVVVFLATLGFGIYSIISGELQLYQGVGDIQRFFGPKPKDCSWQANLGRLWDEAAPWPFNKSKTIDRTIAHLP